MSWQTITFTLPDAVVDIADDANNITDNIDNDCSAATARFDAAIKPAYTKNSMATVAATINHAVMDVTQNQVAIAYVHPWSHGVNQQGGIRGFLSSRNAVKALAKKLTDFNDSNLITGNIEAIVLVFSAVNYEQLSNVLGIFCGVFYLPELAMLKRRCEQVHLHETTKMQVPSEAGLPLLMHRSTEQMAIVNTAANVLSAQMAVVDAYAGQNVSPAQELQSLIAEKSAHIASMQARYESFTATFASGAGSAIFLPAGSPYNKPPLLIQAAEALPEKPLAVAVIMTGQEGSLTLIKAAVGL